MKLVNLITAVIPATALSFGLPGHRVGQKETGADRFGTTPSEIHEGESHAMRLSEEEPDVGES